MKCYILTGTPGSGKTSILKVLQTRGYAVVEEAATDIIALEQRQGVSEPWRHLGFIDSIVHLQRERQLAPASGPFGIQFFDRSPICTYALSQYLGLAPSPVLLEELERIERERVYQRQVFFIDNLGFCKQTEIRRISFAEALAFERIHVEAYALFGYDCVHIAAQPPAKRTATILGHCAAR